jgi:hypothetical protein
MATHHYY